MYAIISLNIFYSIRGSISKQLYAWAKKRSLQAQEEFLHLGGRMQSVAWDLQRPPRVTN